MKNICFISNEAVQLDWIYKYDLNAASPRANVVIVDYHSPDQAYIVVI